MSVDFIPYAERLALLAQSQPEVPAIATIDRDGRLAITRYGELQRLVEVCAANLRRLCPKEDFTAAVVLPNDLSNVVTAAAAWSIGAFVVPLNPNAPPAELAAQLDLIASRGERVIVVTETDALQAPLELTPVARAFRHPSRAVCSGGTTGRPKLIVDEIPWGWSGGEPLLDRVGWAAARRVLIFSPLYHNAGTGLTHRALMGGKSVFLMQRFSAELAVKVVREHAIEFFFAVPTHLQRVLALADVRQSDFDSVLSMYHSGAQCPPILKRAWLDLLGPERVWEIYGATDGTGFTMIRGDEWLEHPGSVGRPVASEIRILDEDRRDVRPEVVGTVFMTSAKSSADAQAHPAFSYIGADPPQIVDGRWSTAGDMGWLDAEGYLYIADRRNDLIITGGSNVYPAEVEAALLEYPGITDVAVIGIPDPQWGHRVHAVVQRGRSMCTGFEELDRHCRERLAAYKIPKSYEFVDELPRTEVGKVSRSKLVMDRVAAA